MIVASGLSYRAPRSQRTLISLAQLQLCAGQFHALLGPNGAGKSTLLRCLCGDIKEIDGEVSLAGRGLASYSAAALATQRAVLPQTATLPFAMSVRDIVAFGRDVYRQRGKRQDDDAVIEQVMDWLEIQHLSDKNYQQLSGGEQHRAQIARVLAQVMAEPDCRLDGQILFLDEPTNHLDVRHQYSLMRLLLRLKARGLTIVCVLHDIALALNHADSLILLAQGRLVGHYTPDQLAVDTALNETYGINLQIHWSAAHQRYVVMPE